MQQRQTRGTFHVTFPHITRSTTVSRSDFFGPATRLAPDKIRAISAVPVWPDWHPLQSRFTVVVGTGAVHVVNGPVRICIEIGSIGRDVLAAA